MLTALEVRNAKARIKPYNLADGKGLTATKPTTKAFSETGGLFFNAIADWVISPIFSMGKFTYHLNISP